MDNGLVLCCDGSLHLELAVHKPLGSLAPLGRLQTTVQNNKAAMAAAAIAAVPTMAAMAAMATSLDPRPCRIAFASFETLPLLLSKIVRIHRQHFDREGAASRASPGRILHAAGKVFIQKRVFQWFPVFL